MDRPVPAAGRRPVSAGHAPLGIRVEPDARDAMPRRSAPSSTTRCSSFRPSSRTTAASGPTASSSSTTARPTGPPRSSPAQPDVMVVESGIRYFEQVAYPPETRARIRETRAVRLWRDQMLDQFCAGQWAVVVDPDEFLALPDGLPALLRGARRRGRRGGLGGDGRHVPRAGAATSSAQDADARFRLEDAWFFDAPAPPRPRPAARDPAGAAHRLSGQRGAALRHLGRPAPGHARPAAPPPALGLPLRGARASIHKTPVVFWRPGDWFLNCHVTSKPVAPRVVPMMHFKFTADLGRKIEYALATGGYNQGSRSYRLYATLIERMRARGRSLRRPGLAALPRARATSPTPGSPDDAVHETSP